MGLNGRERPNASFPPVLSARPRRRVKLLREALARLLLSACNWSSLEPQFPPWCWVGVSPKLGVAVPVLTSRPPSPPTILPLPLGLRSPSPVVSALVVSRMLIGDSDRGFCSPWGLLAGEVDGVTDRRSARPDTRWRGSVSLRICAISGLYLEENTQGVVEARRLRQRHIRNAFFYKDASGSTDKKRSLHQPNLASACATIVATDEQTSGQYMDLAAK